MSNKRNVVPKIGYVIPVPTRARECYKPNCTRPAAPDEGMRAKHKADWDIEYATWPEQRKDFRMQIACLDDDLTAAILRLHMEYTSDCSFDDERRPGLLDGPGYCHGCDASGYEWEYPRWPCRTVQLIAERNEIVVPRAFE